MTHQPLTLGPATSELAQLIRDHDWARTPLGPPDGWPHALRLAVSMCLHAPLPMAVWWGPQLVILYNDAYAGLLGSRHPTALGQPAAQVWPEVWPLIGPDAEAVMQQGEATWEERVRVTLERGDRPEEAVLTWSFSAIVDRPGAVDGVLCTMTEETERVQMEAALSETRRRLDSALIAGEVGTFEWDVKNDRLWGDANFASMFSVKLDPTGAAPLDGYMAAIHPEDRSMVRARIRETLETGRDYEAEYRIVTGAEPRWVVVRGKAERNAAGEVERFPGVAIDVTASRRAESALRQSEEKYRTLFESIDEGFCVVQLIYQDYRPTDYRYLEVNSAFAKHTGLHDVLGRTARELLPELEDHWFEIYDDVARTGEPIRFESGSEAMNRWFDVFAFRVERPEDGRIALLLKDISEQKQADALLRQSRDQLRSVLENSLDAAYRRNLKTDSYDYLSPSLEQVLGITPDQMLSMPVRSLIERIHPDDRDHVKQSIEEGLRLGKGRAEYRFRTEADEYRFVADHFTVQTNADGEAAYRTGIVRDVTEQKRAEQALRSARDIAESASLAKSQFLAVMSHELRTPLTGVIGFADLLETGVLGSVTPRQKEALARIKAGSWHLIGIIDDILMLSRAEAGKEEVRLVDTDLADVTREVVRIVQPLAQGNEQQIALEGLDDAVPVRTDPGKVRQILMNLVGNAVKYAPDSAITVRLESAPSGSARVHVHDTGPGIPLVDQERIFDPFTQVDSSLTRSGSGVGLGLAICRRMARLLGGDVTVVSEPGVGSRFTLHLPAAPG